MNDVYLFENPTYFDEDLLLRALPFLPEERQKKALSYKHTTDRNCCVISYLLFLYGLRYQYNITNPTLTYGPFHKPYLADAKDIYFNISHCQKACVCAFSDREIGIDVQDIRPYRELTAKKVCNAAELELIRQSEDKARSFTRIWSMKESYVKMTGSGITLPLNQIDTTSLPIQVTEYPEFYLSVCEKNNDYRFLHTSS